MAGACYWCVKKYSKNKKMFTSNLNLKCMNIISLSIFVNCILNLSARIHFVSIEGKFVTSWKLQIVEMSIVIVPLFHYELSYSSFFFFNKNK